MSYYNYYQSYQPQHWGTPQYQFPQPPVVSYAPQANWQPYDYYNAHSSFAHVGTDSGVFDYVWTKVKGLVGMAGANKQEARFWHKNLYGGMVNMAELLPTDIGAAAGYEALRFWDSQQGYLRMPLGSDMDRARDALMGLAIAEATKLWGYTGRPADKYGRLEACEVAAATARRLHRARYSPYGSYDDFGVTRRRGSFSGAYDDDFNTYDSYRRPSLHRRRSSSAYHYRPSAQALIAAQPYVATPYGPPSQALTVVPTRSASYGGYPYSNYATSGGYGSYQGGYHYV